VFRIVRAKVKEDRPCLQFFQGLTHGAIGGTVNSVIGS
jgi:hypothetical protein